MSTIKKHLDKMLNETKKLNSEKHVTEADEFTAVNDIELTIHEARKVFERTKNIEKQE